MALSLTATVTPDRLPATPTDLAIRLALKNTGSAPVVIAPTAAKLAAIASYAGVGITWELALSDAPIVELRTYYGPPGNPPPPSYVKSIEVPLAPGAEHVTQLVACWIPRLEPRHLQPQVLDPHGMDNLARLPLADAGVLVLNATWAQIAPRMAADDVLRGHVVAFVTSPGMHELRVSYSQSSWTKEGFHVAAPPVAIHLLR